MEIHKLLARQLTRLGLSNTLWPTNLEQWQNFINAISKVYTDADDERYLIERSMDLSSREIMELNSNLETAQHFAGLGYWNLNVEKGKLIWSKELRNLMRLTATDSDPNYEQFLEMVHPNDRNILKSFIEKAINGAEKHSIEIRVKAKDGTYHWHYTVGAPVHNTKAPHKQLAGITMDITIRKKNEEEINELNQQLLASAREVGMADVAASIIHNIGNVLNSMNVSVNLLNETYQNTNFEIFLTVCKLLQTHANVNNYLYEDEKGKLIPGLLIALSEPMQMDYALTCKELSNINTGVQNIREIIAAQQSLSKVSVISEKISLKDLLELTLKMLGTQLAEKNIIVTEEYEDVPMVYIDRSKLTQIYLNLVQNAKDALIDDISNNKIKRINISIKKSIKENMVEIVVSDNGIGIRKEDLNKIFTYGFTTKKDGHGIGLHSCAICANELGGTIRVLSQGIGHGASFILELPLNTNNEGRHYE